MCRSENEPNGPYRCSAGMQAALLSTKAHYVQAVQQAQHIQQQVETVKTQANSLRDMVDEQGSDVPKAWIITLEDLEQKQLALETEANRLAQKASEWQNKLKEAQKNYDSTRSGLQDLTEEYNKLINEYNKRPKDELSDEEREKLSNKDEEELTDEEKLLLQQGEHAEYMRAKIDNVRARIKGSIDQIKDEREKPLKEEAEREGAEEIDYQVVDNDKDSETKPDGNEADVLINEEVDKALNFMIDDLELSAVDKKYLKMVDPETGDVYDEHELQVTSRKMRREARMRLRRQREADGDTKELMRSFLRNAIYRALRYNKATRKIVRLIGIKQYNDFVDMVEDMYAEHKDQKLAVAGEKWRRRRLKVAEEEYQELGDIIENDEERYAKKIEGLKENLEDGKISQIEHDMTKLAYEEELANRLQTAKEERLQIDLLRAKWASEEIERVRDQERRMETIRQAMIERKRRQEATEEAEQAARI